MSTYDAVFAAANALPFAERAKLIENLWVADAAPLSKAWRAEIASRSAQLDSDEVQTVEWAEVRDQALKRAGLNDAR